jgi:hypothetical protein
LAKVAASANIPHHGAFALTDASHINRKTVVNNAKLPAAAELRCDLGTVDDVFAGQTRDVWTRSAYVFAVNGRDAFSLSSKGPRRNSCPGAATQNQQIIVFYLRLLRYLDR